MGVSEWHYSLVFIPIRIIVSRFNPLRPLESRWPQHMRKNFLCFCFDIRRRKWTPLMTNHTLVRETYDFDLKKFHKYGQVYNDCRQQVFLSSHHTNFLAVWCNLVQSMLLLYGFLCLTLPLKTILRIEIADCTILHWTVTFSKRQVTLSHAKCATEWNEDSRKLLCFRWVFSPDLYLSLDYTVSSLSL